MTDQRLPRDSYLGHAGRLSLKPVELVTKAEDCVWRSSRNHSQNGLSIKRLSTAVPSGTPTTQRTAQDEHLDAWQVSKRQEGWLLKNHPEARVGETALIHQLLSDVNSPRNGSQKDSDSLCLVAAGEMMDFTEPSVPKPVSYLAQATGVGRNIIRLMTFRQERWQCSADENIFIRPMDLEIAASVEYSRAVGPVRSLKCVVDSKPYDPLRILLAQWDTETRLFIPEIGKASSDIETGLDSVASRITPNCVVSISREETGGGNHCDVTFNSGTKSKHPQLAIIDHKGFWTVWDLPGLRTRVNRRLKPRIAHRGSVEQQESKEEQRLPSSHSDWHSIAWVGPPDGIMAGFDDSDYEDELEKAPSILTPTPHSTSLLLCNRKTVKVFDLNRQSFLPSLNVLSSDPADQILEVHVSCHDTSCVCLLTARAVVVMRLTSSVGHDFTKPDKRCFIVSSIPHFRSPLSNSTRLSVTAGPRSEGKRALLLLLYSRGSECMDVLCLRVEKQDQLRIDWRRETIPCLPGVDLAWLQPVAAEFGDEKPQESFGQRVATAQVRFYQLMQAREDDDIQQLLLMVSESQVAGLGPPGFDKLKSEPPQIKETTKSGRRVATRFVIPDGEMQLMGAADVDLHDSDSKGYFEELLPLSRFLGSMADLLDKAKEPTMGGRIESNPFDPVHGQIEDAAAAGSLPATSILELVESFDTPPDLLTADDDWETEMELLKRADSRLRVFSLRRPDHSIGNSATLQGLVDKLQNLFSVQHSAKTTSDSTDYSAQEPLRKMACDLYLASTGLILGDTEEQDSGEISALPTDTSHRGYLVDSSSQPSIDIPSSQIEPRPSQTITSTSEEDPAMKLIRSYTGSGRFVLNKDTELRTLWERGTDPHQYVFDLDKEKEMTEGMQRREKKLARATRKRQRADALLQLQTRGQSDSLPATQPAPEISFVQSSPVRQHSSQNVSQGFSQGLSQPVTMSQPISGPFAQRPKKKAKRKGGF
ncbi:RNA polymerase I-specific transcription-initiation factor-domain-containing protein [Microdochium trichocladiopsis]|uniref:RNA polymerase I-specific transcription-initiation factor-domain-containing protein n=1 Tax=Microdochium trichocladiopsis TaxID=1682393 RepID=A0A9P9BU75_9PEZI|nr:RNA polymerase I-specific transcription-initiation factor-domain-containing protein [Microdochium trichocladiopsis]KAH7040721.1 RNA polymerase I-specific transcription-initiation factor-domain-containing protein [Microdochium trichocladiopsis]